MNFTGMILLVDDEDHIRKYVGLILKQIGKPTLVEAANGEEAVTAYQRDNPDLVLLDVNMPKMLGTEVLAVIRGDATLSRLPVIMLTSSGDERDVVAAFQGKANAYVQKPFEFDALVRAVPMKRLAEPEDIAVAVAFLASERTGYITGQTLSVSGGLTMA